MVKVTLKFSSIDDLLEFQLCTGLLLSTYSIPDMTISATMFAAEIELALNGFEAKVIDVQL